MVLRKMKARIRHTHTCIHTRYVYMCMYVCYAGCVVDDVHYEKESRN